MTGTFRDLKGNIYDVMLGTASGTVELAVNPVTLTMEKGQRKFVGLKTLSATIRVVTDTPLLQLYADGATDVPVNIKKRSAADYDFCGFVVPFAFDQSNDGCADVVEVEAVDVLSAYKEVGYEEVLEGVQHGTSRTALQVIEEICEYVGITKIVAHDNFTGDVALITHIISDYAFIDGEGHGEGLAEVVSEIAMHFGYTALVEGLTLWLYDESALALVKTAHVYTYAQDGWTASYAPEAFGEAELTGDHVAAMNGRVSVERAYGGVEMKVDDTLGADIVRNVTAEDRLDGKLNAGSEMSQYTHAGVIAYRMPMKSKTVETGMSSGETLVPFVETDNYMFPGDSATAGRRGVNWYGSLMMKTFSGEIATYESVTGLKEQNMLWVRLAMPNETGITTPRLLFSMKQGQERTHTGGLVRIAIKARVGKYTNSNPNGYYIPEGDEMVNEDVSIPWLHVKCGNWYLRLGDDGYSWQLNRGNGPFTLVKGTNVGLNRMGLMHYDSGWIAGPPDNGDGGYAIEGYLSTQQIDFGNKMMNFFFEEISILTAGDNIDKSVLTSGSGETLSVDCKLVRKSADHGDRPFADGHLPYGQNGCKRRVLSTDEAHDRHVRYLQTDDVCGVLADQVRDRYQTRHVAYQVTVDYDVKPYDAVTLDWADEDEKTVESWIFDIADCMKTILID